MTRKDFDRCLELEGGITTFTDGTRGMFRATSWGTVNVYEPHDYNNWADVFEYSIEDSDKPYVVSIGVEYFGEGLR